MPDINDFWVRQEIEQGAKHATPFIRKGLERLQTKSLARSGAKADKKAFQADWQAQWAFMTENGYQYNESTGTWNNQNAPTGLKTLGTWDNPRTLGKAYGYGQTVLGGIKDPSPAFASFAAQGGKAGLSMWPMFDKYGKNTPPERSPFKDVDDDRWQGIVETMTAEGYYWNPGKKEWVTDKAEVTRVPGQYTLDDWAKRREEIAAGTVLTAPVPTGQ